MTTTAIQKSNTKPATKSTIRDLILASKDQFAAVLPKHVSVDRLLRVTTAAILRNPDLMACTTESLLGSVMEAAQLGLEPTGRWGGAHLVAFNVKVREHGKPDRWEKRAQVIYDYRGLASVARRSGEIATLAAEVVYEKDEFRYSFGFQPEVYHVPALGNRGERTRVWAAATLKDGARFLKVMSVADVESVRRRSKSADKGPWVTDWEPMACKTVLRRLLNLMPYSIELADALASDDKNDPIDITPQRQERSGLHALAGAIPGALPQAEEGPGPVVTEPPDDAEDAKRSELAGAISDLVCQQQVAPARVIAAVRQVAADMKMEITLGATNDDGLPDLSAVPSEVLADALRTLQEVAG